MRWLITSNLRERDFGPVSPPIQALYELPVIQEERRPKIDGGDPTPCYRAGACRRTSSKKFCTNTMRGAAPAVTLLDLLRQFDSANRDHRVVELFEPHHRPNPLFDSPVVLFDEMVQVLARSHFYSARQWPATYWIDPCPPCQSVPVESAAARASFDQYSKVVAIFSG